MWLQRLELGVMAKLSDFLPKNGVPPMSVLVQAKIDKDLHKKVKELMPSDVGWQELITAACKLFVDEKSSKK